MNRDDYLKIYLALRTADPRYATSAIATLRLDIERNLGEEVQQEIVTEGNSISIERNDFDNIPLEIQNGYFSYLMIEGGLDSENLNAVNHLLRVIFLPIPQDEDGFEEQMIQTYQEYLDEEDYSNARIISNKLLARALRNQDQNLAIDAVNMTLEALNQWPGARNNREYEFEQNNWIRENIQDVMRTVAGALHLMEARMG
ncbi:MAG: hypothetical protein ACOC44_16455 [Promethearchaeia archaeon]